MISAITRSKIKIAIGGRNNSDSKFVRFGCWKRDKFNSYFKNLTYLYGRDFGDTLNLNCVPIRRLSLGDRVDRYFVVKSHQTSDSEDDSPVFHRSG